MTTVDQTTAHVLTSERREFDGDPRFRPRCSCGWFCPRWVERDRATELGDDHLAATTTAPRLLRAAVVQLDDTPAPESKALKVATTLRQLAAFLESNPDLFRRASIPTVLVPNCSREQLAAIARAGLRAGLTVKKTTSEMWAGVDLHFGEEERFGERVRLQAYNARDEVCDRIVVGTKEITEEVPDPDALAAVPKVTVTKVVDEIEWKCLPLLAEVGPAGAR